ncbi:hypothetical protein GH714_011888 [Hevea brasiliensis]|uniref:Nucleolar protein 14 n=1 Tax=Hevea brasiliensis TaxID=3981 RepID=A0A6A6M806_HEVBR|nr:hypothetical protein GH714_011888 [Hevea brasiliensis]
MAKTAKGAGSDKKAKKKNKKNKKSGPSTVAMKLKTPKQPFRDHLVPPQIRYPRQEKGQGRRTPYRPRTIPRYRQGTSLSASQIPQMLYFACISEHNVDVWWWQRKKTLLKEFEQSGKSSAFVDKRIGEKNDELGEFDKAIMRSQRERQLKLSKKSKYNLSDGEEEDLEIQGFGPLLERDDFDDEMLSDDDKDDAEADETRRKSANLKQLNDHDTPNQVEQGMVEGEENKHKTKKEVMEEVILKSKFFKAQKAKDKEENEKLMEELDKSFTSLVQSKVLLSLTEPGKMNALKALVNQSIPNEHVKKDDLLVTQKPEAFSQQGKPDSYDKLVKEMSLDIRAYPSDRTKTPEEIAQEERERLERLEEERQKRMLATNDSSDEENDDIEMPLTQRPRSISGDDLGDSFSFHEEPKARKGWVDEILERRDVDGSENEDDNSSEDSESAEDDGDNEGSDESDNSEDKDESDKTLSLKDWEQSDDDNLGTELEDDEEEYNDKLDDEDEAIEPRGYKKSKKNDNVETREGNGESLAAKNIKHCSTEKEIPFLIEAPKSFEELCALLDNCSNANVMVVINRIRASNAIKLAAENRKKMQVFYGVLLQYFAVLANRKPLNFELLNFLVKPLIEMSMEIPYFSAICARQRILHTRTQFCESLKNSENGCWPSMKTLCLLRLWSMIFPCSDLRHVVMTPALLMCEYLMRCPIMSGRDIAVGSFLCSMVLSVVKQSKKFCPEAIMFLQSLLMTAIERKQASYHESQFYHLVELKALGPVLFIRHCVNEISPLNFFMIMDMPEDSAFLSSDNFSFVKGRDYDPDRERAEGRKLKKQLKREAKGAARELRKDNYFLYEVKEKEKALMEEERAEKYGQSRAFLQEQEHAFKSGQLGKGSKRRR